MKKTIKKFIIEGGFSRISMPQAFEVLCVRNEGIRLVLFVLVDENAIENEEIRIYCLLTGDSLPNVQDELYHLDTVLHRGDFVHIFMGVNPF